MSNDVTCRRCLREVNERNIESGEHVCDEGDIAERLEAIESRLYELEERMDNSDDAGKPKQAQRRP